MDYSKIAIIIGIGINAFLIFTRSRNWITHNLKFILTIPLFIIGLIGILFYNDYRIRGRSLLFLNILSPLILVILDYFEKDKYEIPKKGFYLIVKGSRYQNNRSYKITKTDHFFTIILLLYLALINGLTIFLVKNWLI